MKARFLVWVLVGCDKPCGTDTCSTCCAIDGLCVLEPRTQACGASGLACVECGAGQTCSQETRSCVPNEEVKADADAGAADADAGHVFVEPEPAPFKVGPETSLAPLLGNVTGNPSALTCQFSEVVEGLIVGVRATRGVLSSLQLACVRLNEAGAGISTSVSSRAGDTTDWSMRGLNCQEADVSIGFVGVATDVKVNGLAGICGPTVKMAEGQHSSNDLYATVAVGSENQAGVAQCPNGHAMSGVTVYTDTLSDDVVFIAGLRPLCIQLHRATASKRLAGAVSLSFVSRGRQTQVLTTLV